MKNWFFTLLLCFSVVVGAAQTPDLSFEDWSGSEMGNLWSFWGSGYAARTNGEDVVNGNQALEIIAKEDRDTSEFYLPFTVIPANFTGQSILLEGSIKLIGVENGFAGLFLRLDNAEGQVAVDNMVGQNLHGSSDWQHVEIRLPYSDDITSIYVGVIHAGSGRVLFDDLHLYIDGVDFREKATKEVVAFEALKDREFMDESFIEFYELTSIQESGLYKLGRIWGLMKYYHPDVAKGKYNWDFELFRFLPNYLNAGSTDEQNAMLLAWVNSYGKLNLDRYRKAVKTSEVKMNPDFSWITPSLLGDTLSDALHRVLASERPKRHYYFSLAPNVGNVIFEHEEAYVENVVPDGGFRLLTLFRFWNQVEYFFPYKYAIGKDWGQVLKDYVRPMALAYREPEFKRILLKLLVELNDTHVSLQGSHASIQYLMGLRAASVDVDFIEDKWIVVDFFNEERANEDGLMIGDVVEKINGVSTIKVAEDRMGYVSASNLATKYRGVNPLRTNDSLLHLTIMRDNKQLDLTVKTYSDDELYYWKKYAKNDSCFSMLNDSVAYIFVGNLKQEYVDVAMIEGMDAKALIIDLRCYPSFFPLFELGTYLMPEPKSFCKVTSTSIAHPGQFTFSSELTVGKKNSFYYQGQVIILVNELTQSSAEFHAMAWRQAPNALVVGSQTAGADGNVSYIVLPGGISTQFSGLGVYYPDGTETQRVGIVPDIEVKPTRAGIVAGRDEVLEKALSLVK